MIILFFADIYGRPGRKALSLALPDLKAKYQPDFILGNVENLAGGRGVNKKTTVAFRGSRTWLVTFRPGRYRFVCDPHARRMRGSFRVT